MKKFFGIFLTISLLSHTLLASEEAPIIQSVEARPEFSDYGPWGVLFSFDHFAKFNGSYSVGVTYDVVEKLSVEALLAKLNLEVRSIQASADIAASSYGLRLNYFPFSISTIGLFYTSLLISQVTLDAEVEATIGRAGKRSIKDSHISRQAFVGYRFHPVRGFAKSLVSSRVGIGYGNGKEYGIEAGWKKFIIEDSFLFEAAMTFSF